MLNQLERNYEIMVQACKHRGWCIAEEKEHFTVEIHVFLDFLIDEMTQNHSISAPFNPEIYKHFRLTMVLKPGGIDANGIFSIVGDKTTEAGILRFLSMANVGSADGHFEYDVRDGVIRYRFWLPVYAELTESAVQHSVESCLAMVERFGGGIGRLALGLSDPDTEIEAVKRRAHFERTSACFRDLHEEAGCQDENSEKHGGKLYTRLRDVWEHLKSFADWD